MGNRMKRQAHDHLRHLAPGSHKGRRGPCPCLRHFLGLPSGTWPLAALLCSQGQGGVGTPNHPAHCSPLESAVTKGQ